MTDEERLAEIDARSTRAGAGKGQPYEPWDFSGHEAVVLMEAEDYDYLLSRVRALEAQAVLDATAMAAVAAFRDYATELTLTMKREYRITWAEAETAEYVRLQELRDTALDAALKAREGE